MRTLRKERTLRVAQEGTALTLDCVRVCGNTVPQVPVVPMSLYRAPVHYTGIPYSKKKGYLEVQGYKTSLGITPVAYPTTCATGYERGTVDCLGDRGYATRRLPLTKSGTDNRLSTAGWASLNGQTSRRPNLGLLGPVCPDMDCAPETEISSRTGSFETGTETVGVTQREHHPACVGRVPPGQNETPSRTQGPGVAPAGIPHPARLGGCGSPGPTGRPKGRSDLAGLHRSPVEGIAR